MGLLNRIRAQGVPPPDDEPLSVSGRGHTDGFLQLEELNADLQGRAGLEIFDRMYRNDGDVRQVVSLLANPLIAGTWEVEAAGGSTATAEQQADAAFARWALFENMAPNLRGHLMECLPVLFRSGFTPFEAVWEVTEYEGENVTVPRTLALRLPRTIYRWKQDKWGQLQAIQQYLPVPPAQVIAGPEIANLSGGGPVLDNGDEVPEDSILGSVAQTVWLPVQNLLYYRVGVEGDNWEGVSLLRPAYKHWLFKDAIERMDAIAQEREALGIPVCYPPLSATPDQFDAMEHILSGIRSNAQGYILMPGPKASQTSSGTGFGQGWLIEYLHTGHAGSGRDPMPSLRYHTDKIAASFIAEFIRLGHSLSGGARATAQVQQDPFLVGVEAFSGIIEDIVNAQLVAPLIAYNRPNAKTPPRLKMSLVDATTLSQLADFVLKLVQVGAMLPDQVLEDFLRARADLPPADPDAVAERGNLDDALRREIVMGKNGAQPSDGPAGSTTGGSAPGAKGTDKNPDAGEASPSTASSAHDTLTRRAVSSTLAAAQGLPGPVDRERWRSVQPWEMSCDLDGIEDHFDGCTQRMLDECSLCTVGLARQMASSGERVDANDDLLAHISKVLGQSYDYGQQTAGDEIERHLQAGSGYQLSRAAAQRRGTIEERADHGQSIVLDAMHHAVTHAALQGHSEPHRQRAAERASVIALKGVARTHAVAAFNIGREDRILDAEPMAWGVRYTAILDRNTCATCREADDGVVRTLDDPVRVERKPPNPDCESTLSERGNQCRCFEIPEPLPNA